jgi:hypothetical protein
MGWLHLKHSGWKRNPKNTTEGIEEVSTKSHNLFNFLRVLTRSRFSVGNAKQTRAREVLALIKTLHF